MDRRIYNPGRPPSGRLCEFEGCTGKHYIKGLCRRHYFQKKSGKKLSLKLSDVKNIGGVI